MEGEGSVPSGRIAFSFDGKQQELNAVWSLDGGGGGVERASSGHLGDEVVIERVEGDVAFVEPWTVVEGRL